MFSKSLSTALMVFSLPLTIAIAQAGGVYKCKQADGSITFTNIACPADTVNKEYRGEHTKRQSWENNSGRYSVTRQLQHMEQKKAVYRYERNMNRQNATINKAIRDTQKAEANRHDKAMKYYKEAQSIRKDSAFRRHMSKSKRKAMEDQATALERLGDYMSGERSTVAPTEVERSRQREKTANQRADQFQREAQEARMNSDHNENELIRMRQHENQRQVERNLFGRNMW